MTGSPSVCFLLDLLLLKRLQRLLHLKAGSFQSYHQDGRWNMETGLDSAVWRHWGCVCSLLCSPVCLYMCIHLSVFALFPPSSILHTIPRRSCLLRWPALCEVAEAIIPIVQSGSGFSSVGLELNSCCGGWRRWRWATSRAQEQPSAHGTEEGSEVWNPLLLIKVPHKTP